MEKAVTNKILKVDSVTTKISEIHRITKEEMIFLIKNTPNWKTLELEELSDKNRIPINKLKNDEE